MKIFFISDIQLEQYNNKNYYISLPNPNNIDILAIAGDLGELQYYDKYIQFLDIITSLYNIVILVPGNHEYYNLTIDKGNKILNDIMNIDKYKNLYILNDNYIIIGNYIFFGSCLWSNLTKHTKMPRKVSIYNNNYNYINIDEWKLLHNQSLSNIYKIIDISKQLNKKLIIITHYPPINDNVLSPRHEGNKLQDLYTNSLHNIMLNFNIYIWVYGHSGYNYIDRKVGNTLVITNQYDANNYDDSKIYNI